MKMLIPILSAAVLLTHSMGASAYWMVNTIVNNNTQGPIAIQVGGDANTLPPHGSGIPSGGRYAGNVTFSYCTGHADDQSLNLWVCKGSVGCDTSSPDWIGAINVIRSCKFDFFKEMSYMVGLHVNGTNISKGYKITYNSGDSSLYISLNAPNYVKSDIPVLEAIPGPIASFTVTQD